MDKCETYIKMCKGARRYLPPHQWEDGDFFSYSLSEGKYALPEVYLATHFDEYFSGFENDGAIPLPRQDQLQEMEGGYGWSGQLTKLDRWIQEIPFAQLQLLDTWEQLWLAFVMKEKFGKAWDGEIWN